eukprot:2438877-Rhodomonas_salina.1
MQRVDGARAAEKDDDALLADVAYAEATREMVMNPDDVEDNIDEAYGSSVGVDVSPLLRRVLQCMEEDTSPGSEMQTKALE